MPASDPSVVAIYLADVETAPVRSVNSAVAVAGQGLEGDRYFVTPPHSGPDREITLIESEAIKAVPLEFDIPLDQHESRRNVVTQGIRLNDLVGKTFQVGQVVIKGHRFCEPCAHLQAMTRPGVLKALVHRGGLRAEILVGGTISVGDAISVEPTAGSHV